MTNNSNLSKEAKELNKFYKYIKTSVINTNDGPGQKLASGKINIDTIK